MIFFSFVNTTTRFYIKNKLSLVTLKNGLTAERKLAQVQSLAMIVIMC